MFSCFYLHYTSSSGGWVPHSCLLKIKIKTTLYIYICTQCFSSYLVITKCITENNSTHIQHLALLKYVSHSRLFIILQFPKPHPISLTWVVDPRPVLSPMVEPDSRLWSQMEGRRTHFPVSSTKSTLPMCSILYTRLALSLQI